MIYVLGGGPKAFAFIPVTYPAGSVCSCSMGSRTLKAPDTSGSYVFAVPAAGTWTVSITDGSRTRSRSVSVSTANQIVDGSLSYELVVYRQSPSDGSKGIWAEGYELMGLESWSTESLLTNLSSHSYPATASFTHGNGVCVKAVDVTGFETMEVISSSDAAQWNIYGLSTDKMWYDNKTTNMAVYKQKMTSYGKATETFDLSALSGELYFKFYAYAGTATFSLYGLRFY